MNSLIRFVAVAGLLTASHLFAAKTFEGKVTLAMSAENGRPQVMDYAIKDQKLRMDISAEGNQVSTIMDVQKQEMMMLMPEQRMYMVIPVKKAMDKVIENANSDPNVNVESTGKTEKILGYNCEQLIVTDKERKTVTEMWVASELGMFMGLGGGGGGGPFGGRKNAAAAKWEEVLKGKGGFPLRVITRDAKGKQTLKMEATKVEPGSLPDSMFAPPAGYQKFQMPDMGGLNPFKRN
jgi:hypothetical protein